MTFHVLLGENVLTRSITYWEQLKGQRSRSRHIRHKCLCIGAYVFKNGRS